MKHLICMGFILAGIISLQAQSGSAAGYITDENQIPMPYSNVQLLAKSDSSFIYGVTSDEKGFFTIGDIEVGSYLLDISFLGYESQWQALEITDEYQVELEEIRLILERHNLHSVEIVGRKALFEHKSDRLVLNVGAMPSFRGNSALQVLQKAPGVLVQENLGSITLNNKGEILVMVNDRISRVPTAVLIQQLRGMQAANIDRIELIHQPPAKYDASNASGIIHIIMKENEDYGLTGSSSLTAGMGQRMRTNGNIDLNYRNKTLNLYGSITGFKNSSPMTAINHYREYEYLGDLYFHENKLTFTNPRSHSLGVTIGADIDVGGEQVVGGLFGYTVGNNAGSNYASKSKASINGVSNLDSQFSIDIANPTVSSFANLNYQRQLSPKSSINLDVDRAFLDVQNWSELTNQANDQEQSLATRNSTFEIYTAKGDYVYGANTELQLSLGFLGTFNNSKTRSGIENKVAEGWVTDEAFESNDRIGERILAMYGSVVKKWSDAWETTLGLRVEQYKYALDTKEVESDISSTYVNVFPVLRSSYRISDVKTVALSLNRRIERPSFINLAGHFALIDPTLFVFSNTRLRPAFTNAVRLSYSYRSLVLSLEANQTIGAISFYNTVDKEIGLQTSIPINFDKMNGYILSASFPIIIAEWWKINSNLDASYKKVEDVTNRPLPFEKGIATVSAQVVNTFELNRSWLLNIDGRYMSPFISGDQVQRIGSYVNFGISKKFDNQSTLTFSIQDITATSGRIYWDYHQPELDVRTYGFNDWSERVFQLTYSFTFGNLKVKKKRERSTASEEVRGRM